MVAIFILFILCYGIVLMCHNVLSLCVRAGLEAHQELVKDKLFTIGDMIRAFLFGSNPGVNYQSLININNWEDAENYAKVDFSDFKKSLLPKTEWDIEFNHGKIKLI